MTIRFPVSRPCLNGQERACVNAALDHVQLSQGVIVQTFERTLAQYLCIDHVVAVTSGTTALHLALVALGIGAGDEVLVPDLTFVATANAVSYTGARPILVDVDPRSWCINLRDAAAKVTPRTRAIIPVHLYGIACDMSGVTKLATHHSLRVLEDAAEGFSGLYGVAALGTLGHAGTFSFYGNKVVTCGEGGAVCTADGRLAARLRFLRGQALDPQRRYYHPELGYNYRLTDLQAAIGVGQMSHLAEMLDDRQRVFCRYTARLCDIGTVPLAPPATRMAPWMFTMRLSGTWHGKRDGVMGALAQRGIDTRPGFVPLHRLPMYRQPDNLFPAAAYVADRTISLPTYPELSDADVDEICDAVRKAVA
jgi:perosamine synthetase